VTGEFVRDIDIAAVTELPGTVALDSAVIIVTTTGVYLTVHSYAGESGTCRLRDVLEAVAADVELHRMLVDALRPARG
jgi:hypothetical protein